MGFDFDGDGQSNGDEFIALTNAANPASLFRILAIVDVGSSVHLTYTTEVGRHYIFEYTGNLMTPWNVVPGSVPVLGTGNPITTDVGVFFGFDELFFRVRVGP